MPKNYFKANASGPQHFSPDQGAKENCCRLDIPLTIGPMLRKPSCQVSIVDPRLLVQEIVKVDDYIQY